MWLQANNRKHKKIMSAVDNRSCWQKYLCCCCFSSNVERVPDTPEFRPATPADNAIAIPALPAPTAQANVPYVPPKATIALPKAPNIQPIQSPADPPSVDMRIDKAYRSVHRSLASTEMIGMPMRDKK